MFIELVRAKLRRRSELLLSFSILSRKVKAAFPFSLNSDQLLFLGLLEPAPLDLERPRYYFVSPCLSIGFLDLEGPLMWWLRPPQQGYATDTLLQYFFAWLFFYGSSWKRAFSTCFQGKTTVQRLVRRWQLPSWLSSKLLMLKSDELLLSSNCSSCRRPGVSA